MSHTSFSKVACMRFAEVDGVVKHLTSVCMLLVFPDAAVGVGHMSHKFQVFLIQDGFVAHGKERKPLPVS